MTRNKGAAAPSVRTELLFKPGGDELSPLGELILRPVPIRDFPDDEQGLKLWQLQERFLELIALYQFGDRLEAFRRFVGKNAQTLEHALRRCAWLLPRIDRQLANARRDPDARKCAACPWITGRFDAGECQGRSCPGAR